MLTQTQIRQWLYPEKHDLNAGSFWSQTEAALSQVGRQKGWQGSGSGPSWLPSRSSVLSSCPSSVPLC